MNLKGRSKKLPPRKYKTGDTVIAPGFSDKPLTIESALYNGFTWLYHLQGS